MSTSILTTKLHIPPWRAVLVDRPQLVERLNQGINTSVTLISAPAGYGKSVLASEWIGQSEHPVAWLSLDEADNDLMRWIAYVVAAIQTIYPDFGEMTRGLLQTPQPPPSQTILTALLQELESIDSVFTLAIDDYHEIVERSIHDALAFLLAHLPATTRIMILTRSDPFLPLARLRAQNQLTEIRAEDLRFSFDEAAAFLNGSMELELSSDEIRALEERTEGWVTGLQLAALSMQDLDSQRTAEFIAAFTGGHHYIVDYLIEEVLDCQPETVRDFLLHTSILGQMTGGLCDELTGRSDGQEILERLEQNNLFIQPLDEERIWYRYHHLLADVLENRLQRIHPELVPELHLRASQWFQSRGLIEQAVQHASSGGDKHKAATLIEQNALRLLMRGELATLLNWLEMVAEFTTERPWLSVYKSWALMLTGKLDAAGDWIQKAENSILRSEQARGDEIRGHVESIRAYLSSVRGEANLAVEHAQKALEYLPKENQVVRCVVIFTLGNAYRVAGEQTRAIQALEDARRTAHKAGNQYLELGAISSLADLTFDQGKLHKAFDIYQEILRIATSRRGHKLPPAGMALFGRGLIHYEWNDLNAAEQDVQSAIEFCQQWGHLHTLAAALVLQSRLKCGSHDWDQAREAILRAEELTRTHALALRAESWVSAFRGRLWLAQGNQEAALRWARESGISLGDDFSYLREAEYLTLARVHLASGKYNEMLELTGRIQKAAQDAGRVGSTIEALLLCALAFQAKKDYSQALTLLERALKLAKPEGYLRVFIAEGAPVMGLLRRAGSRGIEPKFTARLVAELNQNLGGERFTIQPLIEPLTERELEVLQCISDGHTNLEIAEQFFLSIGTVKAHTSSIYRKLNVKSRTQAVARAKELGFL